MKPEQHDIRVLRDDVVGCGVWGVGCDLPNTPHPTPHNPQPTWCCAELPLTDYKAALDLQLALVDARRTGLCPSDVLLLLEHFPVFTLGRRGGLDNLRVSESFLEKSGIPVIQAERGGNITYHGPGQIVGYPILDLHAAKLSVTAYVENLEEVMIRTAADFGVKAERNPANRGVWVGNNKLGSIGIAVRRGICFHGFALNANPSTEPFGWINPCGLHGVGMTTLERECQQKISVSAVQEALKGHIESVFGVRLNQCNLLLGGCKAREENRYDGFCK